MARVEQHPIPRPPAVARRRLLQGLGAAGVGAAAGTLTSPAQAQPGRGGASTARSLGGQITDDGVRRAVQALPRIVAKDMEATTVPGVAVAVVYTGDVVYRKGFGRRQVGATGPNDVTVDTVFQLASVSKPISSTVVAAALTQADRFPRVSWDARVQGFRPGFTLADPWVGRHVTVADMFSHRSGLPDHAGDLLEDLGYTGEQIIAKLADYPLQPFRDTYDYTNYGLTAGAEAIAAAAGPSWSALAAELLFKPLGMHQSSFTFADLQSRSNRAALHRKVHGRWVPDLHADNDGQAPAGGASASVNDLTSWLTMLLAQGTYAGARIIDPEQLAAIWLPRMVLRPPADIGGRAAFYGLGWNVSYEDTGELRLGHSGAFGRGAATTITLNPSKHLAIVALTNGAPVGLPEAISLEFLDVVRYGHSTQPDWLAFLAPYLIPPPTEDQVKYSHAPSHPTPARALHSYAGTYANSPYGALTVSVVNGHLSFTVGPNRERFRLHHYSADQFYFQTRGENATGFSGALFSGTASRVTSLTINAWNHDGLGVFHRS